MSGGRKGKEVLHWIHALFMYSMLTHLVPADKLLPPGEMGKS